MLNTSLKSSTKPTISCLSKNGVHGPEDAPVTDETKREFSATIIFFKGVFAQDLNRGHECQRNGPTAPLRLLRRIKLAAKSIKIPHRGLLKVAADALYAPRLGSSL
jgi:hypothetical protein